MTIDNNYVRHLKIAAPLSDKWLVVVPLRRTHTVIKPGAGTFGLRNTRFKITIRNQHPTLFDYGTVGCKHMYVKVLCN